MESERIILRATEPSDLELLLKWENDASHWPHGSTILPYSREDLRRYLDSIRDIYADRQLRLIICEKETQRPLGICDLFDFDPLHQRAAIGILIAEPEDRRKGYAHEAIGTACDYAANVLGLHQLYAQMRESNEASRQLFSKQGFREVAKLPDWYRNGKGHEGAMIFQKTLHH